jgi:hypothetical protein
MSKQPKSKVAAGDVIYKNLSAREKKLVDMMVEYTKPGKVNKAVKLILESGVKAAGHALDWQKTMGVEP